MKKIYKIVAAAACICSLAFSDNANAQWSAMSTGLGSPANAMLGFKGSLFIGGGFFTPFTDITIWNGSSYASAGFTPSQPPLAFASFDSVLYIATYNAIYERIGTSTIQIAILNDPCYALCFWNHMLYAGGWMDSVNHKYTGYIAQYNGTSWSGLPIGVDNWPKAMCVYNGQLAVAGYMNYSNAGDTLYGIGLWNGTKWTPCDKGIKGNFAWALTTMGGNLYMGGSFDSVSSSPVLGKHIWAKNIAMWNGVKWDSVGKGCSNTVYALTTFNSGVVAGGYFDSVMSWDGISTWTTLGALTYSGGAEINGMTSMGNILYIGGSIATAGGVPVSYVAQYSVATGIQELANNSEGVNVYPNPNSGNYTVSTKEKGLLEVYNILGEKVFNTQLNAGYNQVNMANQSKGVYVYRVLSQDGSFISSGKILVE